MPLNGWLILDKPLNLTSARAVDRVKRILKPSKIGHAGTLDPLATGILPLALGEATKLVSYAQDSAKAYEFEVTWGQERDTDDSEGQVVAESDKRPTQAQIEAILSEFTGLIQQTPPNYSAIKIDGKRAYDIARDGDVPEIKAREVRVDSLNVTPAKAGVYSRMDPRLRGDDKTSFICHCGKGTYIRSLARDMGRKLGCYGYISVLRRIRVGQFDLNSAISLENLEELVHKGGLGFIKPPQVVLDDILALNLNALQAGLLKRGQSFRPETQIPEQTLVQCVLEGNLVALARVKAGFITPERVFNII